MESWLIAESKSPDIAAHFPKPIWPASRSWAIDGGHGALTALRRLAASRAFSAFG
jgi:hypothetical protein